VRHSSFRLGGPLLGVLLSLTVAAPAFADLPRTYSAQRVDAPTPTGGARFGDNLVNVGDLDADQKDDILVGQGAGGGKAFVISGASGVVLRTIDPPDPSMGGNQAGFGSYIAKIADIGSCPGFSGTPGTDCPASVGEIDNTLDGVADHVVGAPGVDQSAAGEDTGRVYVLDGKTGAVLKRIDMPVADRDEQATVSPSENLKSGQPGSGAKPGFGRKILSPAGQPPCAGNAGIGACDPVTNSTLLGDMNGDGRGDVAVSAPDYYETASTNSACTDICRQAGRVYVYTSSSLLGRSPSQPLTFPLYVLRNPLAQRDDPNQPTFMYPERFGDGLAPIGDIGTCTGQPGPAFCINDPTPDAGNASNVPDGRPEFVVSGSQIDIGGMPDVGQAYVIDGLTARIIHIVSHPGPHPTSQFGFSNYNQPAPGNLGDTLLPDIYEPAFAQDVFFKGQGRGYVVNGNLKAEASRYTLALLDDPTPSKLGNFGTSSAGIGEIGEGTSPTYREMIVGATGPGVPSLPIGEAPINDVVIVSPLDDLVLQRIDDPDLQPGSGFGGALAPMGDLNGDGFLDFAVGAGEYDTPTISNQGRLYILRSDNSPAPPEPPNGGGGGSTGAPGPPGARGPAGSGTSLAGRNIEFDVSKERVRARRSVKIGGVVEADEKKAACEDRERVVLQRRRPGVGRRFVEFDRTTTTRAGLFSLRIKPRRTYFYRALMYQTSDCVGVVSERQKITVSR
jgi:FG-GAP repeat